MRSKSLNLVPKLELGRKSGLRLPFGVQTGMDNAGSIPDVFLHCGTPRAPRVTDSITSQASSTVPVVESGQRSIGSLISLPTGPNHEFSRIFGNRSQFWIVGQENSEICLSASGRNAGARKDPTQSLRGDEIGHWGRPTKFSRRPTIHKHARDIANIVST